MTASVVARALSVRFLLDRQRRLVTPTLARLRRRGPTVLALDDVDLVVHSGEGVAILGATGAGKTTLLRVLAGVIDPDAGDVDVRGRIGSLLAVEAGLMPTLTGRDNALLLGTLAGLPRGNARSALPRVRSRSGLGDAFDRPVSSYSQGMIARLGYAVVEQSAPQVLLLDEVHEAFDHDYRAVVEDAVAALMARGGIVVATGHDLALLERLCERGVLLRDGRVVVQGDFDRVRDEYLAE